MGKSGQAKPSKAKPVKVSKSKTPGAVPDFPILRKPREMSRVVLTDNIAEGVLRQHTGYTAKDGTVYPGYPLFQAYSGGVLLEQSFNHSSAISAIQSSRLEVQIYCQHPNGRREILSARRAGGEQIGNVARV